jgi:hypothetical protein
MYISMHIFNVLTYVLCNVLCNVLAMYISKQFNNVPTRMRTEEANSRREELPLQFSEANEGVTSPLRNHHPPIIIKRKNHANKLTMIQTKMKESRPSHRTLWQVQPVYKNQHPQIHARPRMVLHNRRGLLLRLN